VLLRFAAPAFDTIMQHNPRLRAELRLRHLGKQVRHTRHTQPAPSLRSDPMLTLYTTSPPRVQPPVKSWSMLTRSSDMD
jgi:hypothetical protein